jgi:putative glutamine amidotransferase
MKKNNKDYLLLWGGVDINPAIYGHQPHPKTQHPDSWRDNSEIVQVKQAIKDKVPIIGVCRGAQLLCALNGGTLYQHSTSHLCHHSITTNEGKVLSSVAAGHHQVMNPSGNYIVYGYDGRESVVFSADNKELTIQNAPEIIWWPDTKCLAIQPHPEWMPSHYPFNIWVNKLIFDLIGVKNVF